MVENSQLFAQCAHSARYAPVTTGWAKRGVESTQKTGVKISNGEKKDARRVRGALLLPLKAVSKSPQHTFVRSDNQTSESSAPFLSQSKCEMDTGEGENIDGTTLTHQLYSILELQPMTLLCVSGETGPFPVERGRLRCQSALSAAYAHVTLCSFVVGGTKIVDFVHNLHCMHIPTEAIFGGVFAQRAHSASYCGVYPGTSPENLPPLEACMSNSKV